MHKAKVLHIDNSVGYTGGFRALVDYIISEKDKVKSVVILPKGSKCVTFLEKEGIQYYEMPLLEIRKSIKSILLYFPMLFVNAWKVKYIIEKERIDVLHSNDLYNMVFYVARFMASVKKPIVTHIRLMPSAYNAQLYGVWRYIHIHFSDRIIAVSKAVKDRFNYEAMQVVYDSGSNKENYPLYQVSNNIEPEFNFLYLSNYIAGKGNDLALEAYILLRNRNIKVTLTFAGGTLSNKKNELFKLHLMQRAKEMGVSDRVFFEEFADDVEFKMKQYDAMLNFSVSESFSMTCFDALRFGIPLIASDCGGPAELFEHEKSGLLVRNGDVVGMSDAMCIMASNQKMREKFSVNSRLYIAERISKSNNFHQLSEVFIGLVKG